MARMRILVVEDERRVASFVSRALRENSYAVDLAETGEKAIEMATATTYDSILLDIRLPGLSGIQVCRELRDRKSTRLNSSHTVISYAVFCLKKKTLKT